MLKIGGESFELNEKETTFCGWIDPYGKGRKPGLTWDLYVSAETKEIDVRELLPPDSGFDLDFPVRDLSPTLDFSEIEIATNDWRSISGFSTEDCSSFSIYVIDEFGHLSMETCSLSFLKREGSLFTVEFFGEGGSDDCGVTFPFQGLLDVRLGGIGMYFLPTETDPVVAGRRLLAQYLPNCSFETHDLAIVPKNAPPEMTRQQLVFLPE